jgi:hypothetical protein
VTCPDNQTLAQWVLGELSEAEGSSFEEHYFVCDTCLERAQGLMGMVERLRASLPSVLTAERRRRLEADVVGLSVVDVQPGQRAAMRLGRTLPLGIWVMHAPLERATRIDLEACAPEGHVLFTLEHVPFDKERGEVVLACQLHYRALHTPAELHVRLMANGPAGRRPVGEYILDHEFESL